MEARAVARYVRVAPRKARLVVDLIRGKSIDDARAILRFSPRAAAEIVEKVLNSAVANAERNAASCISLPMFPELKAEEVDYVVQKCLEWDKANG